MVCWRPHLAGMRQYIVIIVNNLNSILGKKPEAQPGTRPTTTEDPEDLSVLLPDTKDTTEDNDETEESEEEREEIDDTKTDTEKQDETEVEEEPIEKVEETQVSRND